MKRKTTDLWQNHYDYNSEFVTALIEMPFIAPLHFIFISFKCSCSAKPCWSIYDESFVIILIGARFFHVQTAESTGVGTEVPSISSAPLLLILNVFDVCYRYRTVWKTSKHRKTNRKISNYNSLKYDWHTHHRLWIERKANVFVLKLSAALMKTKSVFCKNVMFCNESAFDWHSIPC